MGKGAPKGKGAPVPASTGRFVSALQTNTNAPQGEVAIFAGGCFWGVQEKLNEIDGVLFSEVGYIGGDLDRPTYREVCDGETGHAEAVRIIFDPEVTNYRILLRRFFALHDPTQRNRQGPDHGRQYRSAIFHTSDAQRQAAEEFITATEAAGRYDKAIATEVVPASAWWRAEEYHQNYLAKRRQQSQPDFEVGSLRQSLET